MGTTVVTSLLGFVYWLLAARLFSPADIGVAAALISAMTLASFVATLGIHSGFVQFLPRARTPETWSSVVNAGLAATAAASVCLGLVALVLLPAISSDFDVLVEINVLLLFLAGVTATAAGVLLDYVYIAERRAIFGLVRNGFVSIAKIPMLLAASALGAVGILASWIAATLLGSIVGLVSLKRLRGAHAWRIENLPGRVRSSAASLAGHHAINIGNISPSTILPVLVTAEAGAAAGAFFFATLRVATVFFMISPAVASSLFAEVSHAPGDAWRRLKTSFAITAILLVPVLGGTIVAGQILLGLFGPAYAAEGYGLLVVLALSAVPDAITNLYVSVLRAQGRLRFAALIAGGMAAATIGMAALLVPWVGIVGAGMAWLAAQSLGTLLCGFDAWRTRSASRASAITA